MAKQANYQWLPKKQPSHQEIRQFQEETASSALFAQICLQRGIDTKAKLDAFISPQLTHLYDPFLMYDMEKAVNRIKSAIENGEKILVYGDYDADGITSTSILCEAIETLGGDVHFYLPNRFVDGYGPNVDVFQYMIDVEGVQLIVTCDNGVAGHEAIDVAMAKGVDVVVSDHHELPSELPSAYAIVHPRHPNGSYPFGDLSGAGVAFKIATALLDEIPMESLDLAAIGTVADLVSVTDENRILVHYGLEMLKQTQRIGLQKLIESAGLTMDQLSAESIGFAIGPRLNAIGRLDDATPGVELMMTFDDDYADQLVTLINAKNDERKTIVNTIVSDVLSQVNSIQDNVIVLANENWHAGVLGIVASQVVEKTGKPTVLLQLDLKNNVAKGSARSIQGVNLYTLLTHAKEYLVKFGGHEMAAGLTLSIDQIDNFAKILNDQVPTLEKPQRYFDSEVLSQSLTIDFLHELKQLEPYGTNNEKPIFQIKDELLSQTKWIGDKKQHVKGRVGSLDYVLFNAQSYQTQLIDGVSLTTWVQLAINEWNGIEKPQASLLDTQISALQFFDRRGTTVKKEDVTIENSCYVFFNQKYYDFFAPKLPDNAISCMVDNIKPLYCEHLVLFDCPNQLDDLALVLKNISADNIHVMFHTQKNVYLMGTPTRQQFAQVYKLLMAKKVVNGKDELDGIAKQLNIQKDLLILIIQVFFEVEFVTIVDGVITLTSQQNKVDLMQTKTIQQHLMISQIQKDLLFTSFAQVEEQLRQFQDNKE